MLWPAEKVQGLLKAHFGVDKLRKTSSIQEAASLYQEHLVNF